MALPELAISGTSVVIRGAYNPAIFSPDWLFSRKLIGQTELDAAQVDVISPGLATFSVDWLRLNITPDTCVVATVDPLQFERTRDAAIGILLALQSIPIGAVGINREAHFQITNADRWHAIGDALAPKEIWDDILRLPGMLDVTMLGERSDNFKGRMQVQVQPSVRVTFGVYVLFNDHFDLEYTEVQPQERNTTGTLITETVQNSVAKVPIAVEILSEEWENSMDRADRVIEHVAQIGG